MVGGSLEPWPGRSIRPALELGLGFFNRNDSVVEGSASLAGSGTLALHLDPGGRLSARAFVRRTAVADDEYENLMEERLRLWSFGLAMEIHPTGR